MSSKSRDKILTALICISAIIFGIVVKCLPSYYLSKGQEKIKQNNYVAAYEYLQKAYLWNKSDKNIRYYYVLAMTKLIPTMTIQEELYKISDDNNYDDSAQNLASITLNKIRSQFTKDVANNYIEQTPNDSKVLRWDTSTFPLKICIQNDNVTVPDYYKTEILKAYSQWQSIAKFITFTLIDNPENANIYIKITSLPSGTCQGNVCKYVVGFTEPTIENNLLKRMTITLYAKDPNGNYFSEKELYNTILHETGHALGIMGHSYNPNDLMYMENNNTDSIYQQYRSYFQYLSTNDLNTITLLYRLMPDITNIPITQVNRKGLIYAPIILGSATERSNKKLLEAKNYVKKAPNLPGGYIDLAIAYGELGKTQNALDALDTALTLATKDDDKFNIKYNQAVVCENNGMFSKAEKYALEAQKIQDNSDIQSLLTNIRNSKKSINNMNTKNNYLKQ